MKEKEKKKKYSEADTLREGGDGWVAGGRGGGGGGGGGVNETKEKERKTYSEAERQSAIGLLKSSQVHLGYGIM